MIAWHLAVPSKRQLPRRGTDAKNDQMSLGTESLRRRQRRARSCPLCSLSSCGHGFSPATRYPDGFRREGFMLLWFFAFPATFTMWLCCRRAIYKSSPSKFRSSIRSRCSASQGVKEVCISRVPIRFSSPDVWQSSYHGHRDILAWKLTPEASLRLRSRARSLNAALLLFGEGSAYDIR